MKKNLLSLIAALLLCLPAIALGQTRGLFHETDCGSISNPNVDQVFCLQETTVAGRTAGHTYVWKGPVSGWVDVTGGASAGGDVVGPASATDGVPVLFDGTTGKLVKNSKVVLTQPATLATLTILNNKTFTVNKTLTLDGTDGSTLNVGTGGTLGTAAFTAASAYAGLGANTFTALQTIAQASANAGIITSTGYSLTGSDATGMINLAGTLNTSGNPVMIKIALTNTASGGSTKFISFLAGASGTTEVFNIDKAGNASATSWSINDGVNGLLLGAGLHLLSTANLGFVSGANANATPDTRLFRKSVNVIGAGATIGTTDGFFQGKYNSSDGTAGATTTCTIVGLTSFTVKDGLITSCS